MKALRIVGLLGVVLALYSGAAQRGNATAFPVECVYYCSGTQYIVRSRSCESSSERKRADT